MTVRQHSGLMGNISTETDMIGMNQTLKQSRVMARGTCQAVVANAQPNKLEI
jgi:hypothetical protein